MDYSPRTFFVWSIRAISQSGGKTSGLVFTPSISKGRQMDQPILAYQWYAPAARQNSSSSAPFMRDPRTLQEVHNASKGILETLRQTNSMQRNRARRRAREDTDREYYRRERHLTASSITAWDGSSLWRISQSNKWHVQQLKKKNKSVQVQNCNTKDWAGANHRSRNLRTTYHYSLDGPPVF